MKIAPSVWIAVVTAVAAHGCAHSKHETVTMKVSAEEAHVGLGSNDVQPGDRVAIYGVCLSSKRSSVSYPNVFDVGGCKRSKLGEATIERVLDKDYSIAKVDPGVNYDEGAIVQKK